MEKTLEAQHLAAGAWQTPPPPYPWSFMHQRLVVHSDCASPFETYSQFAMSGNSYFVLVGTRDNPLYEAEFGPQARGEAGKVCSRAVECQNVLCSDYAYTS